MQLTPQQISQWDTDGALLVDGGFTPAQLDAAYASTMQIIDTRGAGFYRDFHDPGLVDLIQHPPIERFAQQLLRSDEVVFCAGALLIKPPVEDRPDDPAVMPKPAGEHVDIQYNVADLSAEPRRMALTVQVWIDDVNARRAPFMYRPGSHHLIAQDWGERDAYTDEPVHLDKLPDLPYADVEVLEAQRGQVTLTSTSLVHAGSANYDDKPRLVMFQQWRPKSVSLRFNMKSHDERVAWLRELQSHFNADRQHLIDANGE